MGHATPTQTNLWRFWIARGYGLLSSCPAITSGASRAWPPRWPPVTLSVIIPLPITISHDGQDTDAFPEADRSRTIAAAPHIIRALKESGYSFATVPELMVLDSAHGHP